MQQQVFHEEAARIQSIQAYTSSLDDRSVSQLLNKEFFFHASRELPVHIPTDPPSSSSLANKLLQQVTVRPEMDTLFEQLDHRMKVLMEPRCDQLEEAKTRFGKDRDRMRQCGAKVRDFTEIYEQELKGVVGIPNALTKRTIGYFQASNKEWPLDQMLSDLIEGLTPQQEQQEDDNQPFDQETKQQIDGLLDQLRLVQNFFNFST